MVAKTKDEPVRNAMYIMSWRGVNVLAIAHSLSACLVAQFSVSGFVVQNGWSMGLEFCLVAQFST